MTRAGKGLVDLTGRRFERLVVTERAEDHIQPSGGRRTRWLCVCDCGAVVRVLAPNLVRGQVRSCGCLNRDLIAERNRGRRFQPMKERVGYSGAHRRMRTARGDASLYRCVDCDGEASDWSYDHSDPDELFEVQRGRPLAYSIKFEHYVPRCKKCHGAFDRSRDD